MKMTGNTMLITGGGSGIGEQLAIRFHALGNRVIVAGRRREALDAVVAAHPGIEALVLDVGDPESIAAAVAELAVLAPELNVLVNNAGIMRFEDVASGDTTDAEATVATNLLGPIRLTAALMPRLLEAGNGVVVTVSSGLAFVPLAATPTYSATKAAIHSWSLSLRHQLKDRVEVIELAPPAVQTDLTPGQSTREGYLPLEAFIDEVMARWAADPTPAEVLVDRVRFQRNAEAEGRFDAAFATINAPRD
jgi:uncharacterized oxidoreductase